VKALLLLLLVGSSLWSVEPGNVRSEFAERFFREKVEPVFVEHCYECHANGRRKGGLSMASLQDLLEGGNEGVVLVPGDVVKSTLVTAVRWEAHDEELNMPPKARLPDALVADLTRWVEMGAPWPSGPAAVAPPPPPA
jgi:mono/diheme cytochrome c family protein